MDEKKKNVLLGIGKFLSKATMTVAPYALTDVAYKKVFYHRTNSSPLQAFKNEVFPSLIAEKVNFKSGKNTLTGYFYHYPKFDKKKIVVFVHGFGNGHHRYLDIINYLASKSILVFSYDATSFDESEGDGIFGFPQAIIDLESAVDFVKKERKYKDKDIIIMGHSMGGYATGSYLNINPKINKVVMLSSFNKSSSLIRQHGFEWAGERVDQTIGYIDEYEQFRFGDYSSLTVVDGLNKSKAKALIVHSKDDKTVPIEVGLYLYKKEVKHLRHIDFITLNDRGHGTVYDSVEGRTYYEDLNKKYSKYLKEKKDPTDEDKINLFNLLVDKDKWVNLLDYSLMDKIVKFIK